MVEGSIDQGRGRTEMKIKHRYTNLKVSTADTFLARYLKSR